MSSVAGHRSHVLHVLVVGFHHKKGSQVEYCYPPIGAACGKGGDGEVTLPPAWQHLPSIALPDGSHNVAKDTVSFILPDGHDSGASVFGVACYEQIAADVSG